MTVLGRRPHFSLRPVVFSPSPSEGFPDEFRLGRSSVEPLPGRTLFCSGGSASGPLWSGCLGSSLFFGLGEFLGAPCPVPPWHWGFRSGVSVAVLGLLVQNPRLIGRSVGLPQCPFGILRWLAEASPPLVEKLSRFSLLMGLSWLLVFSEAIGTGSLFPALVSSSVGFPVFSSGSALDSGSWGFAPFFAGWLHLGWRVFLPSSMSGSGFSPPGFL